MPAQAQNGSSKGTLEMNDGETFLFTSESVGEGHPGKVYQMRSPDLAFHAKKSKVATKFF